MTESIIEAEPILDIGAALGEGSIWSVKYQVLDWIDIKKNLVHTFNPKTGATNSIDVGASPGTVVRRSANNGGGFVIGLIGNFTWVKPDGTVETLAKVEELESNRMNDGKCDPAGRFWCGSMNKDEHTPSGSLYMMDTKQTVNRMVSPVSISNGIIWSRDSKTMFYIDTPTNEVDAFDFDIESGALSNRRLLVKNAWGGHFDGMTIDAENNIYVAIWEGASVLKFDTQRGKLLAKIEVPGAQNATSCAFGGDKLSDLYITTAKSDTVKYPKGGSLFRVELNDTEGLPSYEYAG